MNGNIICWNWLFWKAPFSKSAIDHRKLATELKSLLCNIAQSKCQKSWADKTTNRAPLTIHFLSIAVWKLPLQALASQSFPVGGCIKQPEKTKVGFYYYFLLHLTLKSRILAWAGRWNARCGGAVSAPSASGA